MASDLGYSMLSKFNSKDEITATDCLPDVNLSFRYVSYSIFSVIGS
jgi:hypothetical protein